MLVMRITTPWRAFALSTLMALALPASPGHAADIDPPELPPEPSLQDLLDTVAVPPLEIDAGDPSGIDVFMNVGDEVVFSLTFAFNPLEVYSTEFGIYDVRTPENLEPIFAAPPSQFLTQEVTFSAGAFPTGFGMYLRNTKTGTVIFSQSELNPGGESLFKSFQGTGDAQVQLRSNMPPKPYDETDFIVAFDAGNDGDFNDMFLYVWGVMEKTTVPEPTVLAMLGAGMLGLALSRRWGR